jgi:hypothetical protein
MMSNNNDNSQIPGNFSYNQSHTQLHGDIIGGDKVYGDIGNNRSVPASKGILSEAQAPGSQEQFDRLYRSVFLAIERRPEDPQVRRGELSFIAENIHREFLHESTANLPQVRLWLKQLYSLAPDVFQTIVAVLTAPGNGLSEQTRKEVESVRKECEPVIEMTMPIHVYLENELTTKNLPPSKSEQMRVELQELQEAVHEGNVQPMRRLLGDLTQELPGMKLPLRHWLVESAGIPPAIKVFARNYLDRP